MKTIFLSLAVLAVTALARSQSTPTDSSMDAEITRQLERRADDRRLLLVPKEEKPNEIAGPRVVYSGIAVEVVKTRNPLQLINPAAPPEYGSAEDNVARDPITGRTGGLKLFAINF